MPVRTEVMRARSKPLSRASCARSASPVVTMCAQPRVYSQRVPRLLLIGVDTCRVRTMGGASPSQSEASAASQLSVELCVLITSYSSRCAASQRRIAHRPGRLFFTMGIATVGMPRLRAAS